MQPQLCVCTTNKTLCVPLQTPMKVMPWASTTATLDSQLPIPLSSKGNLLQLLGKYPAIAINADPQLFKCGQLSVCTVGMLTTKKVVIHLLGVNSVSALQSLHDKITSAAPRDGASYTGILHLLGLEKSVRTHLLSSTSGVSAQAGVDRLKKDVADGTPVVVMALANVPQLKTLLAALEDMTEAGALQH